jgi:hypothetical protein
VKYDKSNSDSGYLYADLDKFMQSQPEIKITIKAKDEDYYDKGLHCSGIGSCKRQQVMDHFNFDKNPFSTQTLLTFARGNFYHEMVYRWLEQSDLFLINDKEKDVSDNLPIPYKGKFDVSFVHRPTNMFILADIKTANSNQFKKFSNYLPKEEHIIQLTSYAKGYEAMGHSFDLGLMMYFSTGADLPQFYFVEPYRNIDELIQGYVHAVENYKEAEILPPKLDELFDKKSIWQCSYCNYKDITCR